MQAVVRNSRRFMSSRTPIVGKFSFMIKKCLRS